MCDNVPYLFVQGLGVFSSNIDLILHLMMVKIAKEKALPFEPLVPNDETIEA
jgi:antitoxin component of RelBE/YafQ-DinJ toxin-antitoxin module